MGLIIQHLTDDGNDEAFFAGIAFRNHEGEGGEGAVGNFGLAVVEELVIISVEEDEKEEAGDAFVAIEEGVVFDDEVEEVGGFFGKGGVNIMAVETLENCAEGAVEIIPTRRAKEVASLQLSAELGNHIHTFASVEGLTEAFSGAVEADVAFVVFAEGLEGEGVLADEGAGRVARFVELGRGEDFLEALEGLDGGA